MHVRIDRQETSCELIRYHLHARIEDERLEQHLEWDTFYRLMKSGSEALSLVVVNETVSAP